MQGVSTAYVKGLAFKRTEFPETRGMEVMGEKGGRQQVEGICVRGNDQFTSLFYLTRAFWGQEQVLSAPPQSVWHVTERTALDSKLWLTQEPPGAWRCPEITVFPEPRWRTKISLGCPGKKSTITTPSCKVWLTEADILSLARTRHLGEISHNLCDP